MDRSRFRNALARLLAFALLSTPNLSFAVTGLVAAYGFNEGTGTTVADASGNGNTGTINGATWTTQGRFGKALSFDGVSNLVQIPGSTSLNVSTAMTLEGWVLPAGVQTDWRTIMQRETDAYYLNASNPNGALLPSGGGTFNGVEDNVRGTGPNPVNGWTHVALTYNGATLKLYVNGVQVASRARTGTIQTNGNALRIGGNVPYGEFFKGLIDEVRVYNRALSQAEIQTDMNTPIGASATDVASPSAPTALTATLVGATQINLAWTASTDNVGVTGYRVERCQGAGCVNFVQIAAPITTSFSNTDLTAGATYSYRVRAADAVGNLSAYSTVVTKALSAAPPGSGLMAAYAFNEGAGTTVADASGNGNTGTIQGATWSTAGKFGSALSFDGTSNLVQIPGSSSLNVSAAMTLEGWVFPTGAQSGWRTIMQREVDAYFLNASNPAGALKPAGGGTFDGGTDYVVSNTANPQNAWTHVALTYDGATLKLYVNGVQKASNPRAGTVETNGNALRIGGNVPYGEFFKGLIDEVRVYNRAITVTEIQADMAAPIGGAPAGDTTAPTAPTTLTATAASASQINLSWTASTDNVGVTGYKVERCQGASCSTFAQVATPTTTSFSDTILIASTSYSYRVRATDAAGNLSAFSNTASATTQAPDTTPPSVTGLNPADLSILLANAPPIISAQYSDLGVGVDPATIKLVLDGTDVTALAQVTATGISYNLGQPFPSGNHAVSLTVADRAGNQTVVNWSFTATAVPLIFGETPKDVTLPGGSTPEVGAAYVGRGSGIDATRVVLQFDGQNVTSQATVTATGVFYQAQRLPDATHTVNLSVADLAGNLTADSWTFIVDDPAPRFYEESPRDVFVANRNPRIRVLLSGFNIVASSVRISLDGGDVTALADVATDHIILTPAAALGDGSHVVSVSATDARGVAGQKQWQFTVDLPPPPATTDDGVRTGRTFIPQIRILP